MAVTLDANATAPVSDGTGTLTTIDLTTLTVGSGSNRALVVQVAFGASVTGVTVTWDQGGTNQSCAQIATKSNSVPQIVRLYGLVAPTSGNKTLRVSWTTASQVAVNAICFTNVDQTGGTTTFPPATGTSGSSTTSSISITSATGNMTIDAGVSLQTMSAPTQTSICNTVPGGSNLHLYASRAAGSASNTHAWTLSFSGPWAAVGTDIAVVSPNITLAITGSAGTGSAGTFATTSLFSKALTTNLATGSVGTFDKTALFSKALTTNLATGSVGSVARGATSLALTTVLGTGSPGTLTPVISKSITTNLATGSAGTFTTASLFSRALTGNKATTSVGRVSRGATLYYFPDTIMLLFTSLSVGLVESTEIETTYSGKEVRRARFALGGYRSIDGTTAPLDKTLGSSLESFLVARSGRFDSFYIFQPNPEIYTDEPVGTVVASSTFTIPFKNGTWATVKVAGVTKTVTVAPDGNGNDVLTFVAGPQSGAVTITGTGRPRILVRNDQDAYSHSFMITPDYHTIWQLKFKEVV